MISLAVWRLGLQRDGQTETGRWLYPL